MAERLIRRFVEGFNVFVKRCFFGPVTHTVDRGFAAERRMGAVPVIGVLPNRELILEIGSLQIGRRIELRQMCLVGPLNFAIQVRRRGRNGTET